jgi:hypothetical protein
VRWKLAVAVSDYSHVCDMFGSWCGGRGTYEVAEKTPGEARLRWIVRCWAFGSFISVCENGPEDSAAHSVPSTANLTHASFAGDLGNCLVRFGDSAPGFPRRGFGCRRSRSEG